MTMPEKMAFEKAIKYKGLRVEFEYTSTVTSQQNGHVQQKLATLFNLVRAMVVSSMFFYVMAGMPKLQTPLHFLKVMS